MSSRSDQYGDETHREDDEQGRFEEPEYEGEEEDRFSYLRSWGSGGAWGMWPRSSDDPEADETTPTEEPGAVGGGGFMGLRDASLIPMLIVGGAILYVIPEPATSGLGIALIGVGVVAWLVDRTT